MNKEQIRVLRKFNIEEEESVIREKLERTNITVAENTVELVTAEMMKRWR